MQVPARSIILTGSRATRHGLTPESDYDMLVVMPTLSVPLNLGKLKALEAAMARELGAEVTLSPLAGFRLRRARGNLFLYKLKREGALLWGRDLLSTLEPGTVADIGPQWRFSYLFTGMKHLAQHFQPEFLRGKPFPARQLGKDAAKATLYCGEVLALKGGYYSSRPEEMVAWNSETEHVSLGQSFAQDLDTALTWRRGDVGTDAEVRSLWLKARDYLVRTWRLLMSNTPDGDPEPLDRLARTYLQAGLWPKNAQYFALTLLIQRRLWWRTLWDVRPIDRRVQTALLFLLSSVASDGALSRPALDSARRLLDGRATTPPPAQDNYATWRQLKEGIYRAWPFACPLMGV